MHRPARLSLLLLCLTALVVAALLSLATGPVPLAPRDVLAALVSGGSGEAALVVRELRLPRLVLAMLVGAALACAGAVMQGLFRNPLAEPGLAGISGGAALGAVAVLVLASGITGSAEVPPAVLPLAAFAGGAVAALTVAGLARIEGSTRVATLLLAGLAINAITAAGIGFCAQIADDMALRNLTFWMFGSLARAGWADLRFAAPVLLLAIALMLSHRRALDALLLGEAEAAHLGVAVERVKRRLLLLVVVATATAVALTGIIGFVGLVTPHLVRLLTGPRHAFLLPASALLGALLLTLADLLARRLMAPGELAVGVLTSLIGGPFFLALLIRHRRDPELQ